MTRAAGPLGAVLEATATAVRGRLGFQLGQGANPLVLLQRVAFVDDTGRFDEQAEAALMRWSAEQALGQDPELVELVARRRKRALEALLARRRHVERLRVAPAWHLAVGLGNRANPYEIGLSLHGTYGWPVIPGSTLKGVTCAWATQSGAEPDQITALFGLPRPADPREQHNGEHPGRRDNDRDEHRVSRGTVWFLDALPAGAPVQVARDVLTPHVQPYYRDTSDTEAPARHPSPPAEYHNPMPVQFLVVNGGSFAVDLAGPVADDVRLAAGWCAAALRDLGAGAKTSAGYGYLQVDAVSLDGGAA